LNCKFLASFGALVAKRVVVFNGKFLSAEPSGVHRVAEELIRAVDAKLDASGDFGLSWEIVVPRNARRSLRLAHIRSLKRGWLTWQFWEQFELPFRARGKLLVNLCNLAPISGSGAITMIHDAQVFISPESYSRAFRAWYRFALPRIGANAFRILTVSQFSRDRLVEFGIATKSKIDVVHNGIDHNGMHAADPVYLARVGLQDKPYVLALSNVQAHKNVKILLEAFSRPELASLRLVLFGRDKREQLIQNGLAPPPNVVFVGHVKDAELRALYEKAVCFVFPSTTEGFGLPPLEAMRIGCPVIVAPCGALPEVCADAALYIQPDDADGWMQGIKRLQDDEAVRANLIAKGRLQAAKFSWQTSGSQLLEIILKAAG